MPAVFPSDSTERGSTGRADPWTRDEPDADGSCSRPGRQVKNGADHAADGLSFVTGRWGPAWVHETAPMLVGRGEKGRDESGARAGRNEPENRGLEATACDESEAVPIQIRCHIELARDCAGRRVGELDRATNEQAQSNSLAD